MGSNIIGENESMELKRSEELKYHKEEFFQNTFCGIFHKTASRYPDHIAVEDEVAALTYQELDEYSNFLAKYFLEQGVKRGDIIAIQCGRQVKSVIGILATWKAGAAYIFLDDSYPESRNQKLKKECGYEILLTDAFFSDLELKREKEYINCSQREDLAIIIYTSGSTSRPKGVMIEHQNIMASVSNFHRLGFCETDRVCLFPSFSFVASVYDTCSTLAVGGTLCLIPEESRKKMASIIDFCKKKKITVTFLPPHMAMKFMKYDESELNLRALLVGSEPVRNLEKKSYRIINVYAASETCSLAGAYEITSAEKSYPIGTLHENLRGYIVDEQGNLVKQGETGELWLAGPQIVRGYFKREEKTREQFIKNPFTQEKGYERVFKTNDMVYEQEDGNLCFVTRKDFMYKIRGFRVEAGAVEHAALQCAAIKEVVVTAFEDKGGCNILCGYFTSDEDIDVKELKEKLKVVLPYYMIPTCFIRLDKIPRNVNNKVDRGAIKPPKELDDHKLLAKLY
ncbi:MAG: amino acid adenylation domain-containing protein [Oliverpabstia sp.]